MKQPNAKVIASAPFPIRRWAQPSYVAKGIAKTVLNQDIDLSKHPNFDQNHHIPVPGADDVVDQYAQEEYRREFDQYNTSLATLTSVSNALSNKIMENNDIIGAFAAKH
jgi:hypothetical protein